jgi:hypothetical protein
MGRKINISNITFLSAYQAPTGHRADRAQARCAPKNLPWALWRPLALEPPLLNDRARSKFWPMYGPGAYT